MNMNHYVVYNPYGQSYMSAMDTAHPIFTAKTHFETEWVLRCMERGMSIHLTQAAARKIARKKGKVADTIREVLAQHHRL